MARTWRVRPWSTPWNRSVDVQQALIVGHGRKFVGALIVAHPEHVQRIATEHGLNCSYDELLLTPRIVALFRAELETLQADFSSFERVQAILLPERGGLARHRTRHTHAKGTPSGARAQIRRLDRADVPAGDPLVIPRPEQAMSVGSYKT